MKFLKLSKIGVQIGRAFCCSFEGEGEETEAAPVDGTTDKEGMSMEIALVFFEKIMCYNLNKIKMLLKIKRKKQCFLG
jgi:hypothetical protein